MCWDAIRSAFNVSLGLWVVVGCRLQRALITQFCMQRQRERDTEFLCVLARTLQRDAGWPAATCVLCILLYTATRCCQTLDCSIRAHSLRKPNSIIISGHSRLRLCELRHAYYACYQNLFVCMFVSGLFSHMCASRVGLYHIQYRNHTQLCPVWPSNTHTHTHKHVPFSQL